MTPRKGAKRRCSFSVAVVRENNGSCHFEIRCNACGRTGLALEGDIMRHAKQHFGERDLASTVKRLERMDSA